MDDRDPRLTPAVGDVLEKKGDRREVTDLFDGGQHIFYRSGPGYGKVFLMGDTAWKVWAAKATVKAKGK